MNNPVRLRILEMAFQLFNTKGYRRVTLSELASKLGMSKKTLYQYFSGKEEIVTAVIEQKLKQISQQIKQTKYSSDDPLIEIHHTLLHIKKQVMTIHPLLMHDIEKYLPKLWDKVQQFRAKQLTFMVELLEQAQEQGFTKSIQPQLAAQVFISTVQTTIQPHFLQQHHYTTGEVLDALIEIFMSGIVSPSYLHSKENKN